MAHNLHFSQRWYEPGANVPATGIYEVEHKAQHRQSHQIILSDRERFPACEICDREVRYTLVRAAPFIAEDEDFAAQNIELK